MVPDFKEKPYAVCHSATHVQDLLRLITERKEMTPNEYQKLAARTICPQGVAQVNRLGYSNDLARLWLLRRSTQILHASIGLSGEAGEISSQMQKWLYYGKDLDETNLFEELGDVLWYVAEMCSAMETTMEAVMGRNIEKLRKRYPEKYTDFHAAEENRDREAERKILEEREKADELFAEALSQNGIGFAEPPEEAEEPSPKRSGYELARRIADTYCSGQDRKRALEMIEREEKNNA